MKSKKTAAKKAVSKTHSKLVKKVATTPAKKAASTRATKPKTASAKNKAAAEKAPDSWNLRLYVAGQTPRSITAYANLKTICEQHLPGRHTIEVIDLMKQPHLAQTDQIVALPTLVRKLPEPIKRVIGDLSNLEKVMVGMDLRPVEK